MSADILRFPRRVRHTHSFEQRRGADPVRAEIVELPLHTTMLTDRLWLIRMDDTPEAQAQADRLVEEFRVRGFVVPDYMKGPCDVES